MRSYGAVRDRGGQESAEIPSPRTIGRPLSFIDPHTHTASIQVDVDARTAWAFMADGMEQTHWALGSVRRRRVPDSDLFVGTSSFTGEELYVRLVADEEHLAVDYFIGPAPDALRPLVYARVQPAENVALPPGQSVITMTTWRAGESDADWEREYWVWRTEVHLIKARLESLHGGRKE